MKTGKRILRNVLAAAGMLLATGCIDVEYTGQTFPPQPEGTLPHYFAPEKTVPAGAYRAIGRFKATAPESTDQDDLIDKLLTTAAEHGADAVKVEVLDRVETGTVTMDKSPMLGGSTVWAQQGRMPDGSYLYTDSFGERTAAPDTMKSYELLAQGLFLVREERFKEVVAAWKKDQKEQKARKDELVDEKLVKAPQSLDEAAANVMSRENKAIQEQPAPPPPRHTDPAPAQLQLREDPLSI